jgi:hypothetical protein
MANAEVIEWFAKTFGGAMKGYLGARKTYLPTYRWSRATRDAEQFLRAILPWMKVKRAEAELAICYRRTILPRNARVTPTLIAERDAMYLQLRELKRQSVGKSPSPPSSDQGTSDNG